MGHFSLESSQESLDMRKAKNTKTFIDPDLEAIRLRLIAIKGRWPEVAEISGLHLAQISRFAYARYKNLGPSHSTIVRFRDAITEVERGTS